MNINITVNSGKLSPEDAQSLLNLGFSLEKGIGMSQDYTSALELYKLAATAGNSDAMIGAGRLYMLGLGADQNRSEAAQWFAKAVRKGQQSAMTNLADALAGQPDPGDGSVYKAALKWYRKAAAQDDPQAKFGLAKMYHYGRGTRRNYKKAGTAFLELAKAGYLPAYEYVGMYLQYGYYFPPSYEAAIDVYELGVNQGDAGCMRQMGTMYAEGMGVNQSYELALYWYKNAAVLGDAEAMRKIAAMYEQGQGIRKNAKKAREWMDRAAAALK